MDYTQIKVNVDERVGVITLSPVSYTHLDVYKRQVIKEEDCHCRPAKSHFARQNHTAVVTTKTVYYYSCFFRRYPVK